MTGFETYPTRYALAQITHFFLQSKSDGKQKLPDLSALVYPREPVKEKSEEESNEDLFNFLSHFVQK